MNFKFRIISIASIATLLLWGCRNDIAWSDSKKLPSDGWGADQTVEFMIDPAAYMPPPDNKYAEMTRKAMGDTVKRFLGDYEARLSLRYLNSCNTDSLKVIISQESLTSYQRTDTLTIPLFNSKGEPIGSGHLGIFETEIPFPKPIKVTEGSFITVTPLPYSEKITGITDVSLLLTKTQNR